MPFEYGAPVRLSLLDFCRIWGNLIAVLLFELREWESLTLKHSTAQPRENILARKHVTKLQSCAQFGRITLGIQAGVLLRLSWVKNTWYAFNNLTPSSFLFCILAYHIIQPFINTARLSISIAFLSWFWI